MKEKLPVKTFRLKRRKIYGIWLGAIISLCLSAFFFAAGWQATLGTGLFLFSVLTLVCFILCGFFIAGSIRLYRENYIGLFISSDGFNDISTGHGYGVIFWRDVVDIHVLDDVENLKYKYLVVMVKNPQLYIDREPLQRKKRSLMLKLHYYGSPICFSNRGLECGFEELEKEMRRYFAGTKEK